MSHLTHLQWRKSSRSNGQYECIEIADLLGATAVRDSKDPTGPVLTFTTAAWSMFTTGIRTGKFS